MEHLAELLSPFYFRRIVLYVLLAFVALIFIGFAVVELTRNFHNREND